MGWIVRRGTQQFSHALDPHRRGVPCDILSAGVIALLVLPCSFGLNSVIVGLAGLLTPIVSRMATLSVR